MTIRLVCGPPGAGKNTYVNERIQKDDHLIDLDAIREQYSDQRVSKAIQQSLEASAKDWDNDTWVIRTLADGQARTDAANRIGASEVIVLETDAETAKLRAQERDPETDLEPIDRWWSEYTRSDTDLVIKPDKGLSDKEKNMGDTENSDKGFPADTPVKDMTLEQQVAYWKFHSRKHEAAAQSKSDYDELKEDAQKWRNQEESNKAPDEKALEAAREEGRREALSSSAPRLVTSEFKSQASGKIDKKFLDSFLEDLNHSKYIKDDGDVDTEAVKTRVEAMTPEQEENPRRRGSSSTHQSRRESSSATGSSMDAGRELHEKYHGKKN